MSRSRHQSSVRPDLSRSATLSVNPGENLILPDAPISQEETQLIHNLVHPHHGRDETLVEESHSDGEDEDGDIERRRQSRLPWYKKPSPMWMLVMLPITSIAMSATLAPKVEIYTDLACTQHMPEIAGNHTRSSMESSPILPSVPDINMFHHLHEDTEALSQAIDITTREPSNTCKSDPVVQAAVAKLAAVMTTSMGILSCLTTGWWSSFSDRHGRTTTLGISVVGLLLTDANFILVYFYSQFLPGGYWFLVLGPLIEGSMGGFTTAAAVIHAYLADTTTPATRSRTFSVNLGLIFVGFTVGPTLGGLLIRFSRQTISVFYMSSCVHLLYALMVWFIIPESNSKRKMQLSKAIYQEETESRRNSVGSGATIRVKRLFSFLSPLAVFSPIRVPVPGNPLKPPRRDWNLALLAISYAFAVSVMGSYPYTFQYAAATFNWSSEQLGYWLSLVGSARAFHLTVLLPLCIRLFKRKPVRVPASETEPLLSSASNTSPSTSTSSSRVSTASGSRSDSPSRLTEPHSSGFDLGLARFSLLVEIIAFILMGVIAHPIAFTTSAMLGSLGSGLSPALQSVALEIYNQRGGAESGRLFGALSVIQALSSQIIGPALYGLVFVKTVSTFLRTIFFVSVASATISLIFLSLVRLPRRHNVTEEAGHVSGHMSDPTLVDEEELGRDRGRKPAYSNDVHRA
ncbi:hypothetical protein GYMLUDRAFT_45806 [Collybiopsis luxurians FD-317 M1]|uniref:MFS general substrate transporter n=1 Tax=Collybiopsis luxurians FD-317 M1 TaxID=944289 RepID=A0A0D0CHC7_9AGAR|nr:hypothetical protein GYMLUDRAFT_45806 [Collybiopsis luxurians FD-317 M1]